MRTGKEKERRFFDPLFLHSLTLGTNIQKSNESHQGDITNKRWLRPGGDARQWCAPQPQEGLGLPDEALREDGNDNAVFLAWKHTINQVCFENEHIKAIMETAYFNSHHRIMAYDNLAQQMAKKKVAPDAAWPILGLSAGGSPHVLLHWHPTDHQITQAGPRYSTSRGRVPSAGVGGRATCSCSLTSSTTAGCNWSSSVQATWRRLIAGSFIYSTSRAVRVVMTPLPAPLLFA